MVTGIIADPDFDLLQLMGASSGGTSHWNATCDSEHNSTIRFQPCARAAEEISGECGIHRDVNFITALLPAINSLNAGGQDNTAKVGLLLDAVKARHAVSMPR